MEPEQIDLIGHHKPQQNSDPNLMDRNVSSSPRPKLLTIFRKWLNTFFVRQKEKKDPIVAMRSLAVGKESESTSNFDVNLIPEVEDRKTQAQVVRKLVSSALITIGVLLIAYFYFLNQRSSIAGNLSDIQNQLQMVEAGIEQLRPVQAEVLELRKRVVASDFALDRHLYWTKLLAELEKLTLPSVTYRNFVADQKGVVTLTATASDYGEMAKQMNLFESSENIVEAKVTGVGGASSNETKGEAGNAEPNEVGIEFSIHLTIDPDILNRSRSTNGKESF